MTTDPRRALAALALAPVTAGVFAVAVAWAADRPAQTAPTDLVQATVQVTPSGATLDPSVAAVAEQLDALRTRLAALQAELAARSGQAAQAQSAQAAQAQSAQVAQAAAPRIQSAAPAPRPAPPVDTTTRASG